MLIVIGRLCCSTDCMPLRLDGRISVGIADGIQLLAAQQPRYTCMDACMQQLSHTDSHIRLSRALALSAIVRASAHALVVDRLAHSMRWSGSGTLDRDR